MSNVLKIRESKVLARSPVRLFVLAKLKWLPARSPQHDCHLNENMFSATRRDMGIVLMRAEIELAALAALAAVVLHCLQ